MALVIGHNIAAINARKGVYGSSRALAGSLAQLSSGYRINNGADGPADLVISEKLRSQSLGLERAIRNTTEASNMFGVAEGALNEINSILKKMKGLATHAANNGITSPDQVASDQAEMDSGIQTIDRIASTTRYSDQHLLNGAKELLYRVKTTVDEPTDHALIDRQATRVDYIFKREGTRIAISHTGLTPAGQLDNSRAAKRAYLEADNANSSCAINGTLLTQRQEFVLTGSKGARQFTFEKDTSLGTMVSTINNVRDSTGIGATLIFASDSRGVVTGTRTAGAPDYTTVPPQPAPSVNGVNNTTQLYYNGEVQIYNAGLNDAGTAAISGYTLTKAAAESLKVGYNCDGDGKIYARVIDVANNHVEYYKDKDCTMLVGESNSSSFTAHSNSGLAGEPPRSLDGIFLTLTENARCQDVYELGLVGQGMADAKEVETTGLDRWVDTETAVMSGVSLGYNTSSEGQLFFKYTSSGDSGFKVEVFKDAAMREDSLVAASGMVKNLGVEQAVRVESVIMANGLSSDLNMTLNVLGPSGGESMAGTLSFVNLGIRLYSEEYGSAESIRIQNRQGDLFYQYNSGQGMDKTMLTAGTTTQVYGADTKVQINGRGMTADGLKLNAATTDFSARVTFNAGKLGETTVAVTGYDVGKLYSRAGTLQGVDEASPVAQPTGGGGVYTPGGIFPPIGTFLLQDAAGRGLKDANGNTVNVTFDMTSLNLDYAVDGTLEILVSNHNQPNDSAGMFVDSPLCLFFRYLDAAGNLLPGYPKHYELIGSADSFLGDGQTLDARWMSPISGSFNVSTDRAVESRVSDAPREPGFFVIPALGRDVPTPGIVVRFTIQGASGASTPGEYPPQEVTSYATQPYKNTQETLEDFSNGVQLQLWEGSGDQNRPVYSIEGVNSASLGRIQADGHSTSLKDVMGGGRADLSQQPALAMRVIEQSIADISGMRARLGAVQANTLQTNENSLRVAVENITKTESTIRDTDMAAAMTDFTKHQVMQNASISMLSQANQQTQAVMQLLN